MSIKIGVSSCFMPPDPNRGVFPPKTLLYLEREMALYLSGQGAFPYLIPDLPDDLLDEFLKDMDGFVFQGGTDVSPKNYGEELITGSDGQTTWPGDPTRDTYELNLLKKIQETKKPILGICRGAQIINVGLGGTLYQDIETQKKDPLTHRDPKKYDQVHHPITIVEDGILAKIYDEEIKSEKNLIINSIHHQGVKDLGKNLRMECYSTSDRVIEAISSIDSKENEQFILGVQWHPEFNFNFDEKQIDLEKDIFLSSTKIYQYFLNECIVRKV